MLFSFLDTWHGRRVNISIWAGERLRLHLASNDLGAGAFFRIAPTKKDEQTSVFVSADGHFDISDATIADAVPEGESYWYGLWSGPVENQKLHAHGHIQRKLSIDPS